MLRQFNETPEDSSNVVVIGSGAREAALALSLSRDRIVKNVYVIPGNCGINSKELTQKIHSVELDLDDGFSNLIQFCKDQDVLTYDSLLFTHIDNFSRKITYIQISLVVPGPEKYIVDGVKDTLQKYGIKCFCPSKMASILEGSKSFAKSFMEDVDIPTAKFKVFDEFDAAMNYVKLRGVKKIVIKASGLAGGKGVYLPETLNEATEALNQIIVADAVIEDRLEGQEVSVICICDGYTAIQFPAAQDHKRVYDNDEGPNTGGMGAYSPVPFYTNTIKENVQNLIINKTMDGMRKMGTPFVGALFFGLMLTKDGPFVLEYNVRFGDPEAQVILPLLSDECGLYGILVAAVNSYLDKKVITFKSNTSAVNVVLSSEGYPGKFKKNVPIHIPNSISNEHTNILHSGTALKGSQLVSNGGRVLSIVSIGSTIDQALERSYSAIKLIRFEGSHYRSDIAKSRHLLFQSETGVTYEDAGVSIKTADELVGEIKDIVKCTYRPGVIESIGKFGALFDTKLSGYMDPILVSGADGVGTKLKIAQECQIYDTIGIDLVAMNVNDVVAMGAEPLFFLDYYSCGKLNNNTAKSIISGISKGCIMAGCALVGGETSEMPSLYGNDEFDLAGFCVGAIERNVNFPKSESICDKDVLIGLLSDGLHSNGYSLVRYLLDIKGISYNQKCSFSRDNRPLYEELLHPTKIYVKPILSAIKKYSSMKALAHITGGGISSNLKRILNDSSSAVIDCRSWEIPPIFKWLKMLGNIGNDELERTFNCGIGMIMVASSEDASNIIELLEDSDCPARVIGSIEQCDQLEPSVRFTNMTECW